jgi:hypothetical protein
MHRMTVEEGLAEIRERQAAGSACRIPKNVHLVNKQVNTLASHLCTSPCAGTVLPVALVTKSEASSYERQSATA